MDKFVSKKRIQFAVRCVSAFVLLCASLVLFFSGSDYPVYAFDDIETDYKYKTGDRSPEDVDLANPDIMLCKIVAFGADEQGYIFGTDENATVNDLLEYVGITFDPVTDEISVDVDTPLSADISVRIDRTVYSTVTENEIIPFDTREIDIVYSAFSDNYKDVDGVDGEKTVVSAIKTVNGTVVDRRVISETVTTEPVTAEIHVDKRYLLDLGGGAPTEYADALRIKFTAYNYGEVGGAITATGRPTQVGYVAVDPTIIPYHSLLYIVLDNGFVYGYCYAEDTGGGIKGYRIDVFLPTYEDMSDFGIKMGTCYIVRRGQ